MLDFYPSIDYIIRGSIRLNEIDARCACGWEFTSMFDPSTYWHKFCGQKQLEAPKCLA